jgi:hypothetical protein
MTKKKQTNRFNENSDNFTLITESLQSILNTYSILIDSLDIQSYKKYIFIYKKPFKSKRKVIQFVELNFKIYY